MVNSRLGLALLLFALTLIAYGNSFFSDFVGDDVGRILSKSNHYEKGLGAVFQYIMPDRPFLTFTVWLNWFFGGMNPFGYKLVNVLLHGACAVAVFEFMRTIFRKIKNPEMLAFFAAAIFAVHPINNQAVMSVIQRGVILSTLFSLIAYLLLLKNIKEQNFSQLCVSILFFALALLSKPNAVIFPFVFILLLVNFEGLTARSAFRKCAPFFILMAVPVLQYLLATKSQANAIPSVQYFLVQTQIIFFYFAKYFEPVNLQFLYPFDNFPADLLAINDLKYLALHTIGLGMALWLALQKKSVAAWMIILGYLCFLPESGFFSILHVAFDHRNYVPIIFFAAAFVLMIRRISYSAAILTPAIVALGTLNFQYSAKINTYDNWLSYNLEANPANRSFNIYQLTQSVESGNRQRTERILKLMIGQQDREVISLKSFLGYDEMTISERKDFIHSTLSFALETQVSVHYFYFFEEFLRRELPKLYDVKLVVFGLNSFYFGYLDYWQKYLTAPELYERIRENFTHAAKLAETETAPTGKVVLVRSHIVLYRYFSEKLPMPVDFYLQLLEKELAGQPEAATLKEWLRQ